MVGITPDLGVLPLSDGVLSQLGVEYVVIGRAHDWTQISSVVLLHGDRATLRTLIQIGTRGVWCRQSGGPVDHSDIGESTFQQVVRGAQTETTASNDEHLVCILRDGHDECLQKV